MKTISPIKKARFALMSTNTVTKLLIMIFPAIYLNMIFSENDSGAELSHSIMVNMGIIAYSSMLIMIFIMSFSVIISNLKFYKTLPMTHADITDVTSLNLMIMIILTAVGQTAYIAIEKQWSALPYLLCMDCALSGTMGLIIPWFMKDKYAFAPQKNAADDEKVIKKNTIRVGFITLGYMIFEAAVAFAIIKRGLTVSDPVSDKALLLIVSGAGLILFGAINVYCSKIKNAFES